MTWIAMACLMFSSALAQLLLPTVSVLGQAKWPFLLAVVLYYALRREYRVMLAAALVAGLLQDGLGHTPLGFSVLMFLAVGLTVSGFKSIVLTDTLVTAVIFGISLSFVATLVGGWTLRATGLAGGGFAGLLVKALGGAFLGGLCVSIVFPVADAIDRMAGNVKRKDDIHGYE